ncbi:Glycosyltransferase, DXD sugar-binding motif [uncultured Caudovirales phage]|uniref:Glycosyltransferase, DXD sugar-binding motif n=1 Tax=uncultured Caudovirales phage TaxID=2100421 RepID=A0A6J5ND39_9CAUD|nr:Glycosyltransferase, DXD sugar-binding motif [uncultured Caudovirales phage]
MPISMQSGKASIKWIMSKIPAPKRALDIGCGEGTYAKMFPKLEWTGIEVWEPYVERYNLRSLYPELHITDVDRWGTDHPYDVCFLGDVLEHMEKDVAQSLVKRAKGWADTVIISIPLGHHPQEECEGNPYERHVTDNWTDAEVKEAFGTPTWSVVDGYIGVYVYSKHKISLRYCVYAISKNEEQFVKRFCESSKDADYILIADTGSTDRTADLAYECGAVVHDIYINPWRFDLARNAALALIPRDIDICISLDLDEVLEPGWKEKIEAAWIPGKTTNLWYFFDWGAGIKFPYRKIHSRNGYHWHHPCHEDLRVDGRVEHVTAWCDHLLVSHHPDPTKSRGQYMEMLEVAVKEDDKDPHHFFYYARELTFYQRWEEAKKALTTYLGMDAPNSQNERCYAMRLMGKSYSETGDAAQAEKWFYRAAGEAPNTREPWCELAMLMYRQQRWEECFATSMRALKIKDKQLVYTCDPEVWGFWPHDLASISAWHLGLRDIAYQQARLAAAHNPTDARLAANEKWIKDQISEKIPNVIHMMWFTGKKSREFSYANYLTVQAASLVQKPDTIFMYYNIDHPDNPHWQAIKELVTMVYMEPPSHFEGASLNEWPQYQADVVRLQKLYEHGGIYLDTDSVMLKPFGDLMNEELVLSGSVAGLTPKTKDGPDFFSAGVILAKPKSPFIKMWLERLAEGISKDVWAWHAVNLPAEIAKEFPSLLTSLPNEDFTPFDFLENWVWETENVDEHFAKLKDPYVAHLWDSIWIDRIAEITPEYLKNVDNCITRLLLKSGIAKPTTIV